ncbi:MAG: hypothetical protein PVS3B2_00180 [Candidatus Dormibacteraceae bacterium]
MARVSKSPTISHGAKGTSMKQNTAVGSGSRPGPSKVKIATSAPSDPKGLGRKPAGALK